MSKKFDKFVSRIAVPNLMRYLVAIYITGYCLGLIYPSFFYEWLMLDVDKLLHGQIWRLFTFVLGPLYSGYDLKTIFLFAIMCFFYYSIGNTLERVLGTVRFCRFMYGGFLLNILGVFIFYGATYLIYGFGISYFIDLNYVNLSMFLVYGFLFPDQIFYIYFLIPVKAKYLAIFDLAVEGIIIVLAFLSGFWSGVRALIMILLSIGNFVIFFFNVRKDLRARVLFRRAAFRRNIAKASVPTKRPGPRGSEMTFTRHKCAVCGITEEDAPDMEFRFCTKCNGSYEYCKDHLFTHSHVQ